MMRYLALLSVVLLTSCSAFQKGMKYGIPDVYDYQIFETSTIPASTQPFTFAQRENVQLPYPGLWACEKKVDEACSPEEFLDETGTLALVVIRRDTVVYEHYANGHSRESLTQVFSVTKSFTSTLVGIAIDEGYIQGIHQPVSDFLTGFDEGDKAKITLGHLLNMTSGINFADYSDILKLGWLYYTKDQNQLLKRMKVKYEPGTHFAYSSLSTYILGLCLEKATGHTFAEYMHKKLWEPLGMEFDAKLAIDEENGTAKYYSGLAAPAIDLAKLGRLYLNGGNWNGKQILSESWVNSCAVREKEDGVMKYSRQWWLDTWDGQVDAADKSDFFAGGFRGQLIYVNPEDSTIIVRLGTTEKGVRWGHTLSKLALMPMENMGAEEMNAEMLALVGGKYRNRKMDKLIDIVFRDGQMFVDGFDAGGAYEMLEDTKISFTDKDKTVKLIVNFKDHKVRGLIYEAADNSIFFEKI